MPIDKKNTQVCAFQSCGGGYLSVHRNGQFLLICGGGYLSVLRNGQFPLICDNPYQVAKLYLLTAKRND